MEHSSNTGIRVMHLLYRLDRAGMENGVINICHAMPDSIESSICALAPGGEAENRVDTDRVGLFHVNRLMGNDPTLAVRLARLMRRERVDMLHTHNWVALKQGAPAARLAGVPIVIHGEHGRVRDRLRQKIVQRYLWNRVTKILSVSEALADRMSSAVGFPREKIHVIPNGVDSDRFVPPSERTLQARAEFGLPTTPHTKIVGMVARLVEFKDHTGVFHAVAELKNRGIRMDLALAGSGPLEGDLTALASELSITDRVHFLGELNDVRSLYHVLDLLVSNSSHNEGMSNSVLEAMASAVPIVATTVAASPELLNGGSAGLLVPPRDVTALTNAMERMLSDDEFRSRMSDAARHRAEHTYSITRMLSSYRDLYLDLAAEHGLAPANAEAPALVH